MEEPKVQLLIPFSIQNLWNKRMFCPNFFFFFFFCVWRNQQLVGHVPPYTGPCYPTTTTITSRCAHEVPYTPHNVSRGGIELETSWNFIFTALANWAALRGQKVWGLGPVKLFAARPRPCSGLSTRPDLRCKNDFTIQPPPLTFVLSQFYLLWTDGNCSLPYDSLAP